HRCEGDGCADPSFRTCRLGADFVGDEPTEGREKDSGEKNSEDPQIELGDPVQGEASRGEGPKELHACVLTEIDKQMKNGSAQRGALLALLRATLRPGLGR